MKFKPITYRAHNGYDTEEASNQATLPASEYGESMTIQSQTEDTDINVIVARYLHTGQLQQTTRLPTYGDYTEALDYRSALHAIQDAEDNFMRLSPKIRAQFNNDPQEFLQFAEDPKNIDELRKMGLAKEKPADPPRQTPPGVPGEPPKTTPDPKTGVT